MQQISVKRIIVTILVLNTFRDVSTANHWIVTQSGKIQAYLETPFDLRKPFDLLALLDQETRRNDVNDLYEILETRKNLIETKWAEIEKNSNIGIKITSEDVNCRETGKSFTDIDLYQTIASNGSERGIVFDTDKQKFGTKDVNEPICDNFNKIKRFSTLVNRSNLVLPPDEVLSKKFMPYETLNEFGNYLSSKLAENPSSWVFYNLASFYWRIKGDGNKAIDCLKLSVQFVEEGYRDIPLYNLAGLLHHSRHSKEAAQILLSAIDLVPEEPQLYVALANILASQKEYNKAVTFYDKVLTLEPQHKDALSSRNAILCYFKLESALAGFQADLQIILTDLHEYHNLQQQWIRTQEKLIWEIQPFKRHFSHFSPDQVLEKPKKIQRCIQKTVEGSKKPIISCDFYDNEPDLGHFNLHNLYSFVENENQKLTGHLQNSFGDVITKSMGTMVEKHTKLHSGLLKRGHLSDLAGWPTNEECQQLNLSVNDKEDLYFPVFLSPENKGYPVTKILTDYIGLPEGAQQELPWYPPVCEGDNVDGEKYVSPQRTLDFELKSTDYLRTELLKYVNNGNIDEAEVGQRIIKAMEKMVAPRWVLATLASLYWRVRGNPKKTLDCLDLAFQMVPKEHTDAVLVSLGSTLHQLGLKEKARQFAALAFKINYMEPSTNFLLALIHYENNEPAQAIYYLKNTIKYDKNYYNEVADSLLKTWSCRMKMGLDPKVNPNQSPKETPTCTKITTQKTVLTRIPPKLGLHCYVETDDGIELANLEVHNVNNKRANLGQSIISTLIAAEGSGDLEPDQSRLEMLNDQGKILIPPSHLDHVHIKLSLGEKHPFKQFHGLNDFFVSVSISEDSSSENQLHIYDHFGAYTLSPSVCKKMDLHEKIKYSMIWPSVSVRTLDISDLLQPMPTIMDKHRELKPYCMKVFNLPMPENIDLMTQKYLKQGLISKPEKELTELLQLMAGKPLPLRELGIRLGATLKLNEASWIILTASAIYWMITGNTEYSLICLRAAITQVPNDALDIPLHYLAGFLNRGGAYKDAIEVGNLALRTYPNYALNHYIMADIYISAGQYEKAVAFLRASISLDTKFTPARTKLQTLLCKMLFDGTLTTAANSAHFSYK